MEGDHGSQRVVKVSDNTLDEEGGGGGGGGRRGLEGGGGRRGRWERGGGGGGGSDEPESSAGLLFRLKGVVFGVRVLWVLVGSLCIAVVRN